MNETEKNDILELTPQQELFCVNYTQNDVMRGNATLSYADAFGFDLDSQPHDNAQYQFEDGTIYFNYELTSDNIKDEYHISKGKLIQTSSYDQMFHNVAGYASKLRKRMYIQKRCRELLNDFMVDVVIDARLTEIIIKGDDADALRAIQEYNKLRQRIVDKKDITTGGKPITIVFDSAFKQ